MCASVIVCSELQSLAKVPAASPCQPPTNNSIMETDVVKTLQVWLRKRKKERKKKERSLTHQFKRKVPKLDLMNLSLMCRSYCVKYPLGTDGAVKMFFTI